MTTGSGLLTFAGILAIGGGTILVLLGVLLLGLLFFGKGADISGAGAFVLLTMIGGPLLLVAGSTVILSGFKLMSGHGWARTFLMVLCWLALLTTIACIAYGGITAPKIEGQHIVTGTTYFLLGGLPAIVMLLLLRTEAVRHAMTR